ncbi:MAG: hypothetical protein HC880_18150 [Bacteroidia bacterium]|nr:hypothetical protein [Bacteroidia bacterium]
MIPMLSLKKIVEAIQQSSEKYSRSMSEEHITALIELYTSSRLKEFRKTVVNEIKDLLEKPELTREDIQKIIENILSMEI